MKRVRDSWVAKKLGVANAAKAEEVVNHVAEVMKGDRNKHRVTFYYLVAKQLGKLGDLWSFYSPVEFETSVPRRAEVFLYSGVKTNRPGK